MKRLVKLEVFGQEYPFYTDAEEEDIREIIDLVKSQLESQTRATSLLPAKVGVLVSLNMAGRYVQMKKDHERRMKQYEEKIARLLHRIEGAT